MYRDIDIFQEGGEARSPDLGSIEPLSPLEQQRIFNPTLYQRAIDYLTTQGFTPEQERARTFARGISSLIPGVSTDIAKAEKDILGEGLSLLDLVPVAGPVAKQAVKSGADTIKGFHASSKNFDKFRFPKAEDLTGAKQGGGGFGMQKEGVGLYFTTYPELASAYKTQITDRTRRKGKLYEADIKISEDEMLKNSVRFDQQKPAVLKKLEDSGILQDVKKAETRRLQKQAKLVEKNKKKYEKFKSDLENKKIRNSFANRDKLDDLETDFDLADYYLSDEGLDDASLLYPYNYLGSHLKGGPRHQVSVPGSNRAKALRLSKAGIKGNFYGITGRDMYDDFGARGILSPDVPKEFVIFDPKRIEITKKYQEGGFVEKDLLDRAVEGYEENVPLLAQIAAGFTPPGIAMDIAAAGKYGRDAFRDFGAGNIGEGALNLGIAGLSGLAAVPVVGEIANLGKQGLKKGLASLDDDMLDLGRILEDPKLSSADKVKQLSNHPTIIKAEKEMMKISDTRNLPGYGTKEFMDNRVFNFPGKGIVGYKNAVDELYKGGKQLPYKEMGLPTPANIMTKNQGPRIANIVIGPPAAGKSAISNPLAIKYKATVIDPDEAKFVLPEFRGGPGGNAVHFESQTLSNMVGDIATARGDNLVIPTVGAKPDKIRGLIGDLQNNGYNVNLVLTEIDPDLALVRMNQRFIKKGRLINQDAATNYKGKPKKTYEILKKEGIADGYGKIDTTSRLGEPKEIFEDTAEIFKETGL